MFQAGCRIIGSGAPRLQLPLILLPADKTNVVKPKDAAACAWRGGRGPLPFKGTGGIIWS